MLLPQKLRMRGDACDQFPREFHIYIIFNLCHRPPDCKASNYVISKICDVTASEFARVPSALPEPLNTGTLGTRLAKPMKIRHQSNKITRNGLPVPSRRPGQCTWRIWRPKCYRPRVHYENVHKSTRAQSNMYNICYYSVTRVTLLVQQNSKLLCQSCTLYGDFDG